MGNVSWDVPIKADSFRSTDLNAISFDRSALVVELIEQDTEDTWTLSFDSLQAFRLTTEECSAEILGELPSNGGFFKTSDSVWLRSTGKNEVHFLDDSNHYIVCCYDEIVEIISANKPQFKRCE